MDTVDTTLKITGHEFWIPRSGKVSSVVSLRNPYQNNEVTMIIGNFNAKIGKGSNGDIVGLFSLRHRNNRGDRLVQFCREKQPILTNTFFKLEIP